MWGSLNGIDGVFAFHHYLLAQPTDLPERMINADPDTFFEHFFDTWTTDPETVPRQIRDAYLMAARTPEAIHAMCQDYRASAFVDAAHDAEDREAGRGVQAPTWRFGRIPATWFSPSTRRPSGEAGQPSCALLFCLAVTSSPKHSHPSSPRRSMTWSRTWGEACPHPQSQRVGPPGETYQPAPNDGGSQGGGIRSNGDAAHGVAPQAAAG